MFRLAILMMSVLWFLRPPSIEGLSRTSDGSERERDCRTSVAVHVVPLIMVQHKLNTEWDPAGVPSGNFDDIRLVISSLSFDWAPFAKQWWVGERETAGRALGLVLVHVVALPWSQHIMMIFGRWSFAIFYVNRAMLSPFLFSFFPSFFLLFSFLFSFFSFFSFPPFI